MFHEATVIARIILSRPWVLATFVGCAVVFVAVAWLLARRARWPRSRRVCAALAGAFLALVPATTLARGDVLVRWDRACLLNPPGFSEAAEPVLNVALLAPAAFFAAVALRRLVPVLAAALVVSTLVEGVQWLLGTGTCETADIGRNLLGAVVGVLLAWPIVRGPRPGGGLNA